MATRKKNALDINTSAIQDPYVREALDSIVTFVNSLSGSGIATDGTVTAREFKTHDDKLTVNTRGTLESQDVVRANEGFEVAKQGRIKFRVVRGVLAASGTMDITVPGQILGVTGYSQSNGGSRWILMTYGNISSGHHCYFSNSATPNKVNLIRVINGDTDDSNAFNAIIFYL